MPDHLNTAGHLINARPNIAAGLAKGSALLLAAAMRLPRIMMRRIQWMMEPEQFPRKNNGTRMVAGAYTQPNVAAWVWLEDLHTAVPPRKGISLWQNGSGSVRKGSVSRTHLPVQTMYRYRPYSPFSKIISPGAVATVCSRHA